MTESRLRSVGILQGLERAPARAMLKAVGFTDDDLRKPIVGIADPDRDRALQLPPPGARRTCQTRRSRRRRHAVELNTVSISDAISMGSDAMRASLISREVIADSIELVTRGNAIDALVVLVGCDKTIPGGVMALARLDVRDWFSTAARSPGCWPRRSG